MPHALREYLKDPFLNTFMYQINEKTGMYNQHDLFFSGHTSNLFLIAILFSKKYLKIIFIIITLIMASCLVLQHVHYSIDVLAAPFFSLLVVFLHKRLEPLFSSK